MHGKEATFLETYDGWVRQSNVETVKVPLKQVHSECPEEQKAFKDYRALIGKLHLSINL